MERVNKIAQHIVPSSTLTEDNQINGNNVVGTKARSAKSDDDVVIVSAVRTAIGKGRKGTFKDTFPDDMLAAVLKEVVGRVKVDPKVVDDIQVGNVLQPGSGANAARQAMFYAGFPVTTSVAAVNRQCSSGLQSVANIAAAIQAGVIDVGIGAGVESMSGIAAANPKKPNPRVKTNDLAKDCMIPMGITSENVAKQFGVTREKQDNFAAESYRRAVDAVKTGKFKSEIVAVTTKVEDKDGNEKEVTITEDEGPIPTTLEKLGKLAPAFSKDGGSTAGNSSQVSDGAAAVLLMRRSKAKQLGVKPLARFVSFATAGVPPAIMGIGPALAIPAALEKAGLRKEEVDIYEINEAFASQAVYCVEKLGLDQKKVNPLGGAIALGHPLGCTGARQIATLIPQLQRTGGKIGCTSMCIGTGMGAASVIELE